MAREGDAMTSAEIAVLSVLIVAVVVSRVVRIFEPQVLIICPNPPLPRAIANGNQTSPDGTKQIILYNSL
jgi:hypothetical protein